MYDTKYDINMCHATNLPSYSLQGDHQTACHNQEASFPLYMTPSISGLLDGMQWGLGAASCMMILQ